MKALRALGICIAISVSSPMLLTGCGLFGELKEGMGHAVQVRNKIKSEIGVDASVNFKITNGRKTVTVELSSTPSGDAKILKGKIETIVRDEFGAVDDVRINL